MIAASATGTITALGGLGGLAALLTVGATYLKTRARIRRDTHAESLTGFVELVGSYDAALKACEERDERKNQRITELEQKVFGRSHEHDTAGS